MFNQLSLRHYIPVLAGAVVFAGIATTPTGAEEDIPPTSIECDPFVEYEVCCVGGGGVGLDVLVVVFDGHAGICRDGICSGTVLGRIKNVTGAPVTFNFPMDDDPSNDVVKQDGESFGIQIPFSNECESFDGTSIPFSGTGFGGGTVTGDVTLTYGCEDCPRM